jgi:predicted dehydrogenase/threonine dehydrogenase-like Zn-dependent dehydrogenase
LTTLETAFNRLDQPMPLGYASAGTIVSLGEGLEGFRQGERVACAGGGYAVHAEYAVVPGNLLAQLPDRVDFDSAAFATLGAVAMHGFRLSKAGLGERVAVIGLGLLGLLAVGIARAAGCQVLGVDLDPVRVRLAGNAGATVAVLRPQAEAAAQAFSHGRGCDAILICADTTSADPVELAGAIARDRAWVVAVGAVGLQIPRKLYFEKELSFVNSRSYGPGRYDPQYEEGGQDYPIGYVRWTEGRNLEAFVELLADCRLDVHPLISHRIPIAEAPRAYELIAGKTGEPFLGVLLTYPQTAEAAGQANEAGGATIPVATPPGSADVGSAGVNLIGDVEAPAQQPVSRPPVVRLGVLGAGSFASAVLLPAIQKTPNVELHGILSASGLNAQHAARRYGFRYAGSEQAEGRRLLDDPQINTIAILTRHHLHARQVLAALKAGKHVFCEKPLAILPEELEQIADFLGTETGGGPGEALPYLMVGFNRRFAPLARRLQEFLAGRQEPLAAHYRVNAGLLPPDHWLHDPQQGGGRLVGEGCHFIDFLTFLVGEPPVSVSGQALPDLGRYRSDNLALTFQFPDGSLGTLTYLANGDKAFPKERVEVFCGGKVAVLDDFRSLERIEDGRRKVIASRLRQDKGHRAEWHAFSQAILTGGPPPIPYVHLLGVARAAFAARDALRSGERLSI